MSFCSSMNTCAIQFQRIQTKTTRQWYRSTIQCIMAPGQPWSCSIVGVIAPSTLGLPTTGTSISPLSACLAPVTNPTDKTPIVSQIEYVGSVLGSSVH